MASSTDEHDQEHVIGEVHILERQYRPPCPEPKSFTGLNTVGQPSLPRWAPKVRGRMQVSVALSTTHDPKSARLACAGAASPSQWVDLACCQRFQKCEAGMRRRVPELEVTIDGYDSCLSPWTST